LNGNHLRNEGVIGLLKSVAIAPSLEIIGLADNQFDDEDDVLEAIKQCWQKTQKTKTWDLRYNGITDKGLEHFTQILPECPIVSKVDVSEKVDKDLLETFKSTLALNNPKKKRKGGKKKKK